MQRRHGGSGEEAVLDHYWFPLSPMQNGPHVAGRFHSVTERFYFVPFAARRIG